MTPSRHELPRRTFAGELQRQEAERPDSILLWHDGVPVTFGQQSQRARAAANQLLVLGIGRGQTLAIFAGNCARFVDLVLAAPQAGAMTALLNTALRGSFLAHQLREVQAGAIFLDAALVPRLAEIAAEVPALTVILRADPADGECLAEVTATLPAGWVVLPDSVLDGGDTAPDGKMAPLDWNEPAVVIMTSGTTGPSKGVLLTQHYVCSSAQELNTALQTTADDVQYMALPLFHQSVLLAGLASSLLSGRPTALDASFHPSTCWERIRHFGATQMVAVGPMLKMLASLPPCDTDATLPLRMVVGVPMAAEFQSELEARYRCRFLQGYAMTEVTFPSIDRIDNPGVPGAAGPVSNLYDVRVFDDDDHEVPRGTVGELVVRPLHPHVMFEGYINRPAETLAQMRNLWFHTGDLGRIDENGILYYVDRKKDAIRRRGENISSFEVEQAVMEHPAVADCAAHAVSSPLGEDDVKICVVLGADATATAAELMEHCIDRIPRFALPRYIEFLPELPRNQMMRIQKFVLRERGVTPQTWDRQHDATVAQPVEATGGRPGT